MDSELELELELKVMKTIYDALNELDEDARRRAMDWISRKFATSSSKQKSDRSAIGFRPSTEADVF